MGAAALFSMLLQALGETCLLGRFILLRLEEIACKNFPQFSQSSQTLFTAAKAKQITSRTVPLANSSGSTTTYAGLRPFNISPALVTRNREMITRAPIDEELELIFRWTLDHPKGPSFRV